MQVRHSLLARVPPSVPGGVSPSGYVLRVGSMVRVRLTLQATSTRYHVALVDKLPACLEPLNPDHTAALLVGEVVVGVTVVHAGIVEL